MAMKEHQLQNVASAMAGDRQAFGRLYDDYVREIYDFLYFKTHHKETAQDLTSQTFMKALQHLQTYDADKSSFGTWLYRIARNTATDHYRTKRSFVDIEDAWDLKDDTDLEQDADTAVFMQKIKVHLAKLSSEQRDIVTMRVWQGKSYAEIASIVGKSEASCKMNFSRALKQLRKEMPLAVFLLLLLGRPLV